MKRLQKNMLPKNNEQPMMPIQNETELAALSLMCSLLKYPKDKALTSYDIPRVDCQPVEVFQPHPVLAQLAGG